MKRICSFLLHVLLQLPPPPVVYSTDRSKAVVPVLVLFFVASWFILRGDLFYVLPCVILFLCFSVLLALRLPRLGKREPILVLFVRFFDLRLFGFVCFLLIPLGVWEGLRFVIVTLPLTFFVIKRMHICSFKALHCHVTCALLEPAHGIMVLIACAKGEGSEAPAYTNHYLVSHLICSFLTCAALLEQSHGYYFLLPFVIKPLFKTPFFFVFSLYHYGKQKANIQVDVFIRKSERSLC